MTDTQSYASRSDLLGNFRRRYTTVETPSGKFVRIQNLTEGEKAKLEAASLDQAGAWNKSRGLLARARLLVACTVDGNGHRIFMEEDARAILDEMDAGDVGFIAEACAKWIGDREGLLEDAVKNSEATQDEDSQSS